MFFSNLLFVVISYIIVGYSHFLSLSIPLITILTHRSIIRKIACDKIFKNI